MLNRPKARVSPFRRRGNVTLQPRWVQQKTRVAIKVVACVALLHLVRISIYRSLIWCGHGDEECLPGSLDFDISSDAKGHPIVLLPGPRILTLKLEWKSNAAMLHMNMLPITNKTSQKYTTIMCRLT